MGKVGLKAPLVHFRNTSCVHVDLTVPSMWKPVLLACRCPVLIVTGALVALPESFEGGKASPNYGIQDEVGLISCGGNQSLLGTGSSTGRRAIQP